jgi:arylsulfatase A-like enzyme
MTNRREFLQTCISGASAGMVASAAPRQPNVVLILADDLGYGDLGSYGCAIQTPNLDRLASQGIRFTQAYVASPVCSPSRVAITTGQYPARCLINSYLDTRKRNREQGMRDYLDPAAPSIARAFQKAGYATAHLGKWHMGGGRDVDDAPLPAAYGFDESFTSFEGLGDRVLWSDRLSQLSEKLGRGKIVHGTKTETTEMFVNRGIDFVRRNRARPFYLQLWPNDVHDPFEPKPELMAKYSRFSGNKYLQQFYAVLDEMDRQIGRFIDAVDQEGLANDTLIVFIGDNGPTAWPRYYKEGFEPPGSSGGLRGRKWSLYEGGIREPLIVRQTGRIPAGKVDRRSVVSSVDFFPTLCRLAGIPAPAANFDGQDLSAAFLGRPRASRSDLYWEYGRDETYPYPGTRWDRSPNCAIRSGNWKALVNADGSGLELYDLERSPVERDNLAMKEPGRARELSDRLLAWRRGLPALAAG